MPPKTKQPSKRSKKEQPAPQELPLQEEEHLVDDPLQQPDAEVEIGAAVNEDDDTDDITSAQQQARTQGKKGPSRVPHKDIEDYPFSAEQVEQMVEFLKQYPQMYDRKHREFCNSRAKVNISYL